MTRHQGRNSRFQLTRGRSRLAVAVVGGLLLSRVTAALAASVMLPPGGSLPVPETSGATESDLDGIALRDALLPFTIRATDGAVVCTGKLQDRVVRSTKTGLLEFYYRIRETAGPGAVGGIATSSFSGAKLGVAYRIDGQGTVSPHVAVRSAVPGPVVTFELTDPPVSCAQHEESRFIVIKTESRSFRPGGETRIFATTGVMASVPTAEP